MAHRIEGVLVVQLHWLAARGAVALGFALLAPALLLGRVRCVTSAAGSKRVSHGRMLNHAQAHAPLSKHALLKLREARQDALQACRVKDALVRDVAAHRGQLLLVNLKQAVQRAFGNVQRGQRWQKIVAHLRRRGSAAGASGRSARARTSMQMKTKSSMMRSKS